MPAQECIKSESLEVLKVLWDALKDNYPIMEYAGALDDSWFEEYRWEVLQSPAPGIWGIMGI